jgi:outer membrane protein
MARIERLHGYGRCLFVLLFFMVLPLPGVALPLADALAIVRSSNPAVKEAYHNMQAALERRRQAVGSFLPELEASSSYDIQRTNTNISPVRTTHPRSYALTLSQPLFRGGELGASYRARTNEWQAAKAIYVDLLQEKLVATTNAYMDTLTAQDVLNQQKKLVNVLTEKLKATQVRFEQGDVTQTDVGQAQARLAEAQAAAVQAEGSLITARTALQQLLGQEPPAELVWPPQREDLPSDLETVEAEVAHNHPRVLAALHELTAQGYEVTAARSAHFPDITATASIRRNEQAFFGSDSRIDTDIQTVGVQLSLPLFRGGRIFSSVREAANSKAAAAERYETARREVLEELHNAYQAYRVARASAQAFELAVKANTLAARGVSREAELGDRSVLDVLDAEQELLDAQVQLTQAQADTTKAAYRYLAAMGRLSEKSALE